MSNQEFPVTRGEAKRTGIPFSSTDNYNAEFPKRLRELRNQKGLSQQALSETLGVSKSTVGLWETGDTLPDAKNVALLAKTFGVTADYLVVLSDASSKNMSIRSLCDELGLTQYAASRLITIASHYPHLIQVLSAFMESEEFSPILKSLELCSRFGDTKPWVQFVLEKNNLMPEYEEGKETYEEQMIRSDKSAYRAYALYEPQRLLGLYAERLVRSSENKETASGDGNAESGKQGR